MVETAPVTLGLARVALAAAVVLPRGGARVSAALVVARERRSIAEAERYRLPPVDAVGAVVRRARADHLQRALADGRDVDVLALDPQRVLSGREEEADVRADVHDVQRTGYELPFRPAHRRDRDLVRLVADDCQLALLEMAVDQPLALDEDRAVRVRHDERSVARRGARGECQRRERKYEDEQEEKEPAHGQTEYFQPKYDANDRNVRSFLAVSEGLSDGSRLRSRNGRRQHLRGRDPPRLGRSHGRPAREQAERALLDP